MAALTARTHLCSPEKSPQIDQMERTAKFQRLLCNIKMYLRWTEVCTKGGGSCCLFLNSPLAVTWMEQSQSQSMSLHRCRNSPAAYKRVLLLMGPSVLYPSALPGQRSHLSLVGCGIGWQVLAHVFAQQQVRPLQFVQGDFLWGLPSQLQNEHSDPDGLGAAHVAGRTHESTMTKHASNTQSRTHATKFANSAHGHWPEDTTPVCLISSRNPCVLWNPRYIGIRVCLLPIQK